MIEIWKECSSFQPTSQRLADQVRTMINKCWFSDLEVLEIHLKINNQQGSNTISDTSIVNQQKQPNQTEAATSENGNIT